MADRSLWALEGNMYLPSGFAPGEFNGIDYMLIHNIYRLTFANQISGSYVTRTCPCLSSKQFLTTPTNLLNLDRQPIDVIGGSSAIQSINTVFRFPDYKKIGIPIPEYLSHQLDILSNGDLNIGGDLSVCGNSITVHDGGQITVLSSTETDKQKYFTIGWNASLNLKEGSTLEV